MPEGHTSAPSFDYLQVCCIHLNLVFRLLITAIHGNYFRFFFLLLFLYKHLLLFVLLLQLIILRSILSGK